MALITKTFANFFRSKKNSFGGHKKESFSKRDLRLGKKIEDSDEVTNKHQSREYVNQIKYFECRKPGHIAVQCYDKQNHYGKRLLFQIATIVSIRKRITSLLLWHLNPLKPYQYNLQMWEFIDDDEDDQEEILKMYNELMREHIKLEEAQKKGL